MAKIKEYYPSLVTDEYELGQFYMFNRNNKIAAKKISDNHRAYIVETKGGEVEPAGGFAIDDGKGGFALDKGDKKGKGGFAIDDGTKTESVIGGFRLDSGSVISETEAFESFAKKTKSYGHYTYEAGRIIGINEEDSKIYVQFSDTKDGYCHIFKTGIPSNSFDLIDRIIQANGR